ncbi:hypothetical protein M407DRAFT_34806 [Tulasnella calospora MUT 4182]|uniref:Uncharacterized protein n=1 Tax=Tulasnella calospora MUT 4182 TaxID=1051891 RepID=A0A0C3PMN0_9AGAM|nr:hypothetical protein M407DRAFT_34806 [Tulasnella calospora MUT 4182]
MSKKDADVFLLKSSFATSPTIVLSSPRSTYSGRHRRRRFSGLSKQLMATTTSLDAVHQYQWAPAVSFPLSPSATPALSSRASSPESSPQSLATPPSLAAPSALPSSSSPPPPYSFYANDHQIATLAAILQKQPQQS